MRTSKTISTISYNSVDFLTTKLNELIDSHKISDYMFIQHKAEVDEKKDHIHLWIKPNKLLDTMSIQEEFKEVDPNNPDKPLKCIDFRLSKTDDWILYSQHVIAYLKMKGESREFHYLKEDFYYYDEDTFDYNYEHALRGSDFAKNQQFLELLNDDNYNPANLIKDGFVPLEKAVALSAYDKLDRQYNFLDRNGRAGHE